MTPGSAAPAPAIDPGRLKSYLDGRVEAMVDLLTAMVEAESPTDDVGSQAEMREILTAAWGRLGYRTRHLSGDATGGSLLFVPRDRVRGTPVQLMIGHLDTVWPLGTLQRMPAVLKDGLLRGPGVFDMKGGLVQMIFAVEALQATGVPVQVDPVAFVNSDEEIGSPESRHHVRRLAKVADRAWILEPSMGPEGRIKTRRKGVGHFEVSVRGKAAHAGLEPESGRSAILELAHVIQALHQLNRPDRGLTVNVGVVDGGSRANVVAEESRAKVDVRAMTWDDALAVTEAIRAIKPATDGVFLHVDGQFEVPPLERTPRNLVLWEHARALGADLGLELDEVTAGGGSDGNTTSQYTATLDGLGPRGDGAHAEHEHVVVESLPERTALLAALLALPPEAPPRR